MSQPGKQTVALHILLNISQNKWNENDNKIKFCLVIEYFPGK